ncbi:transmembrane protein 98 [Moschus berezovskii]|nr:transmembrane protein 98 [Moschus berezovskii]
METVVIVAIGVLATIFLASFAALVVVCRQRYCRPRDLLQCYDSKPIVDLIGAMETQSEPSELELDDVVITNPHIEAILENEDWIEDASGLMSHCIAILKICHTLTEKLVAMTMGSGAKMKTSASVSDIIVVAKRISPRVDDVVKSMYPPLDPKLLDARTTALLLSVSHLVLVTRNACHLTGGLDWIDQSLTAAEEHLRAPKPLSCRLEGAACPTMISPLSTNSRSSGSHSSLCPGAADQDGVTPVTIALSKRELGSRVARNLESTAVGRVAQPCACPTPAVFATGGRSALLASYQCSQGWLPKLTFLQSAAWSLLQLVKSPRQNSCSWHPTCPGAYPDRLIPGVPSLQRPFPLCMAT